MLESIPNMLNSPKRPVPSEDCIILGYLPGIFEHVQSLDLGGYPSCCWYKVGIF